MRKRQLKLVSGRVGQVLKQVQSQGRVCREKFSPGDHIMFCDEEYIVVENHGSSGIIKDMSGVQINSWYWRHGSDHCILKEEWEQQKILEKNW